MIIPDDALDGVRKVLDSSVHGHQLWSAFGGVEDMESAVRRARSAYDRNAVEAARLLVNTFLAQQPKELTCVDWELKLHLRIWTLPIAQPDLPSFLPNYLGMRECSSYSEFVAWALYNSPEADEATAAACDLFFHIILCVDQQERIWPDLCILPLGKINDASCPYAVWPMPLLTKEERIQLELGESEKPVLKKGLPKPAAWGEEILEYLAHRDERACDRAIDLAPNSTIVELIHAYRQENLGVVAALTEKLLASTTIASNEGDALVVALLQADMWTWPVLRYEEWSTQPQVGKVLVDSIDQCGAAIRYSTRLASEPCIARYSFLAGVGYVHTAESEKACRQFERALKIQQKLASDQPDLYAASVCFTLNNLAIAYREAKQFDNALTYVQQAIDSYRRLMVQGPGKFTEDFARTLNNAGVILGELQRHEAAINHYNQALSLYRELSNPDQLLQAVVATILYNIGMQEIELLDWRAAEDHLKKAESIYRLLIIEHGEQFKPRLAETLNGLLHACSSAREFDRAQAYGQAAVDIYRQIVEANPAFSRELAMVHSSLGVVFHKIKRLTNARESFDESITIYRRLATKHGEIYRPEVALVLHDRAAVLRDQGKLDSAEDDLHEALSIRRRLAKEQRDAYESHMADTLGLYGTVMAAKGDWEAARKLFQEELEIRRQSGSRNASSDSSLALALSNLGNVHTSLGNRGLAQSLFEESIEIRESRKLWIEASESHCNLGTLYDESDRGAEAIESYWAAVVDCERGLAEVSETCHRDLAKSRIESAYMALISHIGAEAAKTGEVQKAAELMRLMDSLRHVETLAQLDANVVVTNLQGTDFFLDLVSGRGELAKLLTDIKGAVLYIHVVQPKIFFVIVASGHYTIEVGNGSLVNTLFDMWDALNAHSQDLEKIGSEAFMLLPAQVQEFLGSSKYETIFLAPCRTTINVPFELLCIPSGVSSDASSMNSYLGLQYLLPRTHGLSDLSETLKRSPSRLPNRSALVVGNPIHEGFPMLPAAREMALKLAKRLSDSGFTLIPNDQALIDRRATAQNVLKAVNDGALRLWCHMGHGASQASDVGGGVEYLALADQDRLLPTQIAEAVLDQTLVWFDCCVVGTTRAHGGGKLEGYPVAALLAGATSVLASVQPLFDKAAAEFSEDVFRQLLDTDGTYSIGEAVLQTRRFMATRYHETPAAWANTIVWGNPLARLI